jgi:hypothetical protein
MDIYISLGLALVCASALVGFFVAVIGYICEKMGVNGITGKRLQ